MNVVFGSVIYPEAMPYFDEFLISVKMQSFKKFRLLILSDGIRRELIEEKIRQHHIHDYEVVYCEGKNPVQLRVMLLLEARKRQTELIVLGDADDTFSYDRIESVFDTFTNNTQYAFAYNDLRLKNNGSIFPCFPKSTESIDSILKYNYLGLSNTAIRISNLSKNFIESLNECESFVFDWYLFSRMLLCGYTGRMTECGSTFYRVYDNNYAGIPKLSDESVKKEIKVKEIHYRMMSKYDARYNELYESYKRGEYDIVDNINGYYWWNFTKWRKL